MVLCLANPLQGKRRLLLWTLRRDRNGSESMMATKDECWKRKEDLGNAEFIFEIEFPIDRDVIPVPVDLLRRILWAAGYEKQSDG